MIGSDKHDEDGSNKNHTTEHCGVDSDTMLISGRTIPDTFLVDADEGKNSQADESDDEQALEIGIDECSLLKECLEKKYASLTATDER